MAVHDERSPVEGHYSDDQTLKVEVAALGDVDKEHKEQVDAVGPRKKKFIRWYLTKKQWIAALVGSIIFVIGLLLLILWFAVAVPLFQSNADKVKVSLNHLDILSIEKSSNTLGVNVSLRLTHDLNIHATTDATKADLLFDGEVFAALDLPALDLKKGEQAYDLVITGDALVSNAAAFEKMASALVTQPNITVDASARLKAHALGLSKGGLKFDRTLQLTALNNFKEPETAINLMSVTGCTSESINIMINATVDNVALIGLDGIGALNLSLYYQQDYLGYAVSQLPELGLPRGSTNQMFGVVIQNSTEHLPVVAKMVQGIALGSAQFFLTGTNDYATDVDLLKEPLKQLNMSILYTDSLKKVSLGSCTNQLIGLIG
ncbi:E3 ubiquitin-protein ligase, partial [Globisporangium splendens]